MPKKSPPPAPPTPPAAPVEPLDYSKLGPDIAAHRRLSNRLFGGALFAILLVVAAFVFNSLRHELGSGKHATSLGTAKG